MLDQVAETYARQPDGRLRVTGNSDASDGDDAISIERAAIARDYLSARGVPAESISVEAFGDRRPTVETLPGQPAEENRSSPSAR